MLFSLSLHQNEPALVQIHFHGLVLCGPDTTVKCSLLQILLFLFVSSYFADPLFLLTNVMLSRFFPVYNSGLPDVQTLVTDLFFKPTGNSTAYQALATV